MHKILRNVFFILTVTILPIVAVAEPLAPAGEQGGMITSPPPLQDKRIVGGVAAPMPCGDVVTVDRAELAALRDMVMQMRSQIDDLKKMIAEQSSKK